MSKIAFEEENYAHDSLLPIENKIFILLVYIEEYLGYWQPKKK